MTRVLDSFSAVVSPAGLALSGVEGGNPLLEVIGYCLVRIHDTDSSAVINDLYHLFLRIDNIRSTDRQMLIDGVFRLWVHGTPTPALAREDPSDNLPGVARSTFTLNDDLVPSVNGQTLSSLSADSNFTGGVDIRRDILDDISIVSHGFINIAGGLFVAANSDAWWRVTSAEGSSAGTDLANASHCTMRYYPGEHSEPAFTLTVPVAYDPQVPIGSIAFPIAP